MATEKRLIDAIALKRHMIKAMELANTPAINEDDLVYAIDHSDTVDAVEVVHGRWDDSGRYQFPSGAKAIRCSICGCALSESEYRLFNWNYCPVCGARMDGDGNG